MIAQPNKAALVMLRKAQRAAAKKMPLKSDRQILQHLDFAGMDQLETYKCGVEEAQSEICNRLAALEPKL